LERSGKSRILGLPKAFLVGLFHPQHIDKCSDLALEEQAPEDQVLDYR
jgi:hypothetical protein